MSLTPSLEKTLLNFASYASVIGRQTYAQTLRETLLMPEPDRTSQLNILKHSISEIFNITVDQIEFRDFVRKFDFSANDLKEFLKFLGPDSGLKYYPEDDEDVYVTLPSYLKSVLEERLYDKLSLLIKLEYGKNYWEHFEYSEMNRAMLDELLDRLENRSPKIVEYLKNTLESGKLKNKSLMQLNS